MRYKGMKVNLLGLPIESSSEYNKKEKVTKSKRFYNFSFNSPFRVDSPKNLIVMYDIPHEKKKERDWFRRQLQKFDYIMIQKSVWVGPSPLPKEFLEYVERIGLKGQLKSFKLAKSYNSKGDRVF